MNSPLNPSNPRVGISNSIVVNPFSEFIDCSIPLRFDTVSMIVPAKLSSTLMINCSNGSCFLPFSSSLTITCGGHTCNSRPSLRIVSINTDKCNSPLHDTKKRPSSKSTFNPTFVSSSFVNLSCRFLVVIYFPSLPAKGESFTRNSIFNVGSSIEILGNGENSPTPIVSHTKIVGIPAIVTISPHSASFHSTLCNPSVVNILLIFHVLFDTPSFPMIVTCCPAFAVPS